MLSQRCHRMMSWVFFFKQKRSSSTFFLFLSWQITLTSVILHIQEKKTKKTARFLDSRETILFPWMVSKSSTYCSSTFVGIFYCGLLQLAEQNKQAFCRRHSPWTIIASSYPTSWSIYGVKKDYSSMPGTRYGLYYTPRISPCNNACPSDMSISHILRTTAPTPKLASPIWSPRRCRHVNTFSVVIFRYLSL